MSHGPSSASATSGLGNAVCVGNGVLVGCGVGVGVKVTVAVAVIVGVAVHSSGSDCVKTGVLVGGGGGSLLHAVATRAKKISRTAMRFMQYPLYTIRVRSIYRRYWNQLVRSISFAQNLGNPCFYGEIMWISHGK